MVRKKFDPTFGPDSMTVIENGRGGVTCVSEQGVIQRRHLDDIKQNHTPGDTTPTTQEKKGVAPTNPEPTHSLPTRKNPVRARKTPARFNDYIMDSE